MKREKCATKFCRGEVALIYLRKPLCQECYEKICDEEDKKVDRENGEKTKNEIERQDKGKTHSINPFSPLILSI